MIKRFLEWIKRKEKLDKGEYKLPLFKEAEIWWCSVGENIGVEIGGKSLDFSRPVLIFKKLSKESFLGLPMTTKQKEGSWYVKVKYGGKNVIVILSQARVFSTKRLHTKIGELDDEDCVLISRAFADLYLVSNKKFPPPRGGVVGKSQK